MPPVVVSLDERLTCAACDKGKVVHVSGEQSGSPPLDEAIAEGWVLLSPANAKQRMWLCPEHASDPLGHLWWRYERALESSRAAALLHAKLEAMVQTHTGQHHRAFSSEELLAELAKAFHRQQS